MHPLMGSTCAPTAKPCQLSGLIQPCSSSVLFLRSSMRRHGCTSGPEDVHVWQAPESDIANRLPVALTR